MSFIMLFTARKPIDWFVKKIVHRAPAAVRRALSHHRLRLVVADSSNPPPSSELCSSPGLCFRHDSAPLFSDYSVEKPISIPVFFLRGFSCFHFPELELVSYILHCPGFAMIRSVIDELKQIKVVNMRNRELVLDLLQSVVEIITYGDKHDPSILDENSRVEAPLLQYLSIMIQNMDNEHAIYYCFSNGYINSIILHPYELDGGDLAPYYMSFLRDMDTQKRRN
ncbi:hypothetical protein S83_023784 [Arachis hypogaea]